MNIDLNEIIKTALSMGAVVTISPDYVTIVPDEKKVPEAPKEASKPEPKPAAKKSTKKDLDMGKVRALRDAGWSLDQIAVEMHCSPQTIANRLKGEADV